MLELTDPQWAALQSGACPPFHGLNALQLDCEEANKAHADSDCAECWEKWLEITKKEAST